MIIKKQKTLSERLRTLPSGEWVEIKNRDYKASTVRDAIGRLRKKGFVFEATESGLIDSIKVLRINR